MTDTGNESGRDMNGTGEGPQGPLRVMVVDDHPMWRDAVARDLAESGFDVVATAGADEPKAPQLTDRETEVLRLVAKGLSYKQIAERLVISHRTVQNHVQNTLGKLQLHNRVELVRYAIQRGLDDE